MKEIEFVDLFCSFLEQKGYEFKREMRKGSYHNEGYVDIVIKSLGYLCYYYNIKCIYNPLWNVKKN